MMRGRPIFNAEFIQHFHTHGSMEGYVEPPSRGKVGMSMSEETAVVVPELCHCGRPKRHRGRHTGWTYPSHSFPAQSDGAKEPVDPRLQRLTARLHGNLCQLLRLLKADQAALQQSTVRLEERIELLTIILTDVEENAEKLRPQDRDKLIEMLAPVLDLKVA